MDESEIFTQKYQTKIFVPIYEPPEVTEQRERDCDASAKKFLEKYGPKDLFQPSPKPKVIQKSEGDSRSTETIVGMHTWYFDDGLLENYHRRSRGYAARNFRMYYKFLHGDKICISSEGSSFWSDDKCYDSTWIGVHGMDSICMVTRRQEVDMTRVERFYQRCCTNQQTMRSYAQAVISEVESLPYDDDFSRRFGRSIEKPFCVVSVVPNTKNVHGESGHEASSAAEYDVDKATAFLKKKMNSGLAFTCDETIQTAISAFQQLCLQELKAEDIWVTTLRIEEVLFEHMHLDQRKEHLAVISGDSSGVSGPSLLDSVPTLLDSGPIDASEILRYYYHAKGVRPCNCYTCRSEKEESDESDESPFKKIRI